MRERRGKEFEESMMLLVAAGNLVDLLPRAGMRGKGRAGEGSATLSFLSFLTFLISRILLKPRDNAA